MLSYVQKEFTLWRIFWYSVAFFYGIPLVLVVFAVLFGLLVVPWR